MNAVPREAETPAHVCLLWAWVLLHTEAPRNLPANVPALSDTPPHTGPACVCRGGDTGLDGEGTEGPHAGTRLPAPDPDPDSAQPSSGGLVSRCWRLVTETLFQTGWSLGRTQPSARCHQVWRTDQRASRRPLRLPPWGPPGACWADTCRLPCGEAWQLLPRSSSSPSSSSCAPAVTGESPRPSCSLRRDSTRVIEVWTWLPPLMALSREAELDSPDPGAPPACPVGPRPAGLGPCDQDQVGLCSQAWAAASVVVESPTRGRCCFVHPWERALELMAS